MKINHTDLQPGKKYIIQNHNQTKIGEFINRYDIYLIYIRAPISKFYWMVAMIIIMRMKIIIAYFMNSLNHWESNATNHMKKHVIC
jgi:hypothetical protein